MADIDISVNIPSGRASTVGGFFTLDSGPINLTANTMSGNITISFGQTLSSIPDAIATITSVGSETASPTSVNGSVSVYVDKVTNSSCVLKAISSTTQQVSFKVLIIK